MLILNTSRTIISQIGYDKIADFVLGKKYDLSLVFIGKKKMRDFNLKFRQKDYATNILSFPLSKNEGEIFICPLVAKKEARNASYDFNKYLKFLFIHGITHLKGFDHGSRMEKEEEKTRKKFSIIDPLK